MVVITNSVSETEWIRRCLSDLCRENFKNLQEKRKTNGWTTSGQWMAKEFFAALRGDKLLKEELDNDDSESSSSSDDENDSNDENKGGNENKGLDIGARKEGDVNSKSSRDSSKNTSLINSGDSRGGSKEGKNSRERRTSASGGQQRGKSFIQASGKETRKSNARSGSKDKITYSEDGVLQRLSRQGSKDSRNSKKSGESSRKDSKDSKERRDKKRKKKGSKDEVEEKKVVRVRRKFLEKARYHRTVEMFDHTEDTEMMYGEYLKYFSAQDIDWMVFKFESLGGNMSGVIRTEFAIDTCRRYMQLRWNESSSKCLTLEDCEVICETLGIVDHTSLHSFVELVYVFQQKALDSDEYSGFSDEYLLHLKQLFPKQVEHGVKPVELFSLYSELGHSITKESQESLLRMYKAAGSEQHLVGGAFPFTHFLYLMQRMDQEEDKIYRERERRLITGSKFKDKEIDEFRALYNKFVEPETQEMSLAKIKRMFENMNLPLTRAQMIEVATIIRESDENANDSIDFGEFCSLLRGLWDRNFANLQSLTAVIEGDGSSTSRQVSKGDDMKVSRNFRRRGTIEQHLYTQTSKSKPPL